MKQKETATESRRKVVIVGAAGRDFHNFNTFFRNRPTYDVVAFTAAQIPDIDGRKYPAALAGPLYPKGIPILAENELESIIEKQGVDLVVFAYSDVTHEHVMHIASRVHAAGANYLLLGPNDTMIESTKPVVSVCAVRTGCGKSQTTRRVIENLQQMGKKVVAIRHPMPYGDLVKQTSMRFASLKDLDKFKCTIEEREEFEPHIDRGVIIYCGVDYEVMLRQAEKEADVIVWDGGNNDFPFYKSDLEIVVVDPLRPGHEMAYHPGETNLRRADVVVINKIESAYPDDVQTVRENIRAVNKKAVIIDAASPITVDKPEVITGKRVVVVEDGPTLTHGEMDLGAGIVAAQKFGAAEIVDPRPWIVGTIADTFKKYPGIGTLIPAMGYSDKQIADLEKTINKCEVDSVVIGTPIDLTRILKIKKPMTRVMYELQEIGRPDLADVLRGFVAKLGKGAKAKGAGK